MRTVCMRPVRRLFASADASHQVAVGCTLGMLIGLLPKDNLLILMLAILLVSLPAHKIAGLLALGVFSLVGRAIDPLAHQLGGMVLLWEPARPLHIWLYNLPLSPWLALNHSIVLGQFMLGCYLIYPTFWIGQQLTHVYQARLDRWILRYRWTGWMRGAKLRVQWGLDS